MKGEKRKKHSIYKRISLCIIIAILFTTTKEDGIVYAAEAETKDINLNLEGQIAGLNDPKQISGTSSEWSGNYLYFGEYKKDPLVDVFGIKIGSDKEPVTWRILDANTTAYSKKGEPTILLLSDKVIGKAEFNSNSYQTDGKSYVGSGNPHYANEYAYSNIRKWLNSEDYEAYEESKNFQEGFYKGAFSSGEQNAIAVSIKAAGEKISGYQDNSGLSQKGTSDKVFLLSSVEVLNPLYGFFSGTSQDTIKATALKITDYAEKHGVTEEKDMAAWWLRSADPTSSNIVYHINSKGQIGTANVGHSGIGVAPAINIKLSSIAFTYQSGK